MTVWRFGAAGNSFGALGGIGGKKNLQNPKYPSFSVFFREIRVRIFSVPSVFSVVKKNGTAIPMIYRINLIFFFANGLGGLYGFGFIIYGLYGFH